MDTEFTGPLGDVELELFDERQLLHPGKVVWLNVLGNMNNVKHGGYIHLRFHIRGLLHSLPANVFS